MNADAVIFFARRVPAELIDFIAFGNVELAFVIPAPFSFVPVASYLPEISFGAEGAGVEDFAGLVEAVFAVFAVFELSAAYSSTAAFSCLDLIAGEARQQKSKSENKRKNRTRFFH